MALISLGWKETLDNKAGSLLLRHSANDDNCEYQARKLSRLKLNNILWECQLIIIEFLERICPRQSLGRIFSWDDFKFSRDLFTIVGFFFVLLRHGYYWKHNFWCTFLTKQKIASHTNLSLFSLLSIFWFTLGKTYR